MSIDLHCHSNFSDGSFSVYELINFAKKLNLKALSITDHDCVDANEIAFYFSRENNLEYIPGVELSCKWIDNGELHALGYYIDYKNDYLKSIIKLSKELRDQRNPLILKKLKEKNMFLNMEDVENEVKGDIIGRPHIAKALLKKGYVQSIEEAFSLYLQKGKACYVEKEKITPELAVEAIEKSSGIPFIAHPISLDTNLKNIEKHLLFLIKIGFKGIEVFHPDQDKKFINFLLNFARKNNILISGGSDFHNITDDKIYLGCINVSYDYLIEIKNFMLQNQKEIKS